MTEQIALDGQPVTIGATGRTLTARQQRAFDLVRTTAGGLTAEELGARLHADAGKHDPDAQCTWCESTGRDVLGSAALGPLVVRRRASGRYELRDKSGAAPAELSSQMSGELPGSSFADIFGGAA